MPKTARIKEERGALLFLLPSLLGLLLFFLAPFAVSLYYVLINNTVAKEFVGFANIAKVWSNGVYQLALRNSLFFPQSPVYWLETGLVRGIITAIFLWKNMGFNMVLFLAGLGQIPKEYYETAMLEGAGAFAVFRRITVPALVPTGFLVLLMSIIHSFKAFREIYALTGAYPHESIYMLQHYMNNQFTALDYQKLASSAYILSAFIVCIVLVFFRLQRKFADNIA